jgi:PAS domain S-box-containing protein
MTEVPQDFVNITSGLGDARPDCILIVPLKLNNKIEGVIELASMKAFKNHEVEFVKKLGETIASAITTVRTAENTKVFLEQSQQQTEEMRAQEEEMRQNMEELQATQEQIHRKNEEVEELLKKATEKEEAMKAQNLIMVKEKKTLEIEMGILNTLMEITQDRITVKDTKGKYLKLSKSKLVGMEEQGIKDIFSKSDREMFGEEHYKKSFSVEQELMKTQKPVLNIEEKIQLSKEKSIWGLTSRVPFKDKNGNVLGTVVLTRNITKEKLYREELENLKNKS